MNKHEELLAKLGLEKKDTSSDKDLKKLLNSYIEVMRHKLGRVPTTEELLSHMSGNDDLEKSDEPVADEEVLGAPTQDNAIAMIKEHTSVPDPSFVNMKVFHGRTDGNPDISKVLYYEHPNGLVYDTHQDNWLFHRPEVLNHLDSRPMLHDDHDLMQAIMHGMIDDNDYKALETRGLLTGPVQKMWDLSQDLKRQYHELGGHKNQIMDHQDTIGENQESIHHLLDVIADLSQENQQLKDMLEERDPTLSFGDHMDGPDLTDDSIQFDGVDNVNPNGGIIS